MRRAIGRERDQARLALRRPRRLGRRVGENDDRRLQALGTVHRHHPHLVARHLHVALHFGTRRAQPVNEALQRRRLAPLVFEREIEEFIERIGRPRDRAGRGILAGLSASSMRVEGERQLLAPIPRNGRAWPAASAKRGSSRLGPQRRAQRAFALLGELEQIVVIQTEQRALQHGRQREIVVRQQQRVGQHHQVHHRDMLGQHQPVGAGDRIARP